MRILKLPLLVFTIHQIHGETCLKHEVYSISENKCVPVCQTDITVCMEPTILSKFFTTDRNIDFGVTCSTNPDSPGACNCDPKKGLIKTDPENQFAKCKGPENWCENLDFQEYACDLQEKTCTCVDKNECHDDNNQCFIDGLICIDQTFEVEKSGFKCGEKAGENEVLNKESNEYFCEDGFVRDDLEAGVCKKVVACEEDSCGVGMKCVKLIGDSFRVNCECELPNEEKSADETSCTCKKDHIKIDNECVYHRKECMCGDTKICKEATPTAHAFCESKCKTEDFYTSLNQTCTAETGEVKCDEGFMVSEHSEGEVEVVCVEQKTNIGSMYVIGIGIAIAVILGLILFMKSRQAKHTAGVPQNEEGENAL